MTIEQGSGSLELGRRVEVHAALADPHRLRIVDLLGTGDFAPSELAELIGIRSNLFAHHVAILERAGLVERIPSAGDGRRRYLRLIPQMLGPEPSPDPILAGAVLFICTGNSARSQMAAALWNRASEVPAESAGTHPEARVHLLAVRAAGRWGLRLGGAVPRPLGDVKRTPDLVVTVCDRAHEEIGASIFGARVLHWSTPDPADAGTQMAFDETLARLDARVATLRDRVVPPKGRTSARRTR
ncbi:MAG TPA: helix-turn-helix domain-containing protein [Actinomycetota bacterium]|nr:helix-turn-helix domain-containing protein [Actinomycetota bacterium]